MQLRTLLYLCAAAPLLATLAGCSSSPTASESEDDDSDPVDVTVTVDLETHFQRIDGFGFFGARDVWWTGDEDQLYSESWAERAVHDLGISIWRNEYYPPSTDQNTQDAQWDKQRPVVKGLHETAQEHNVDLKFVFSVWSPPARMKVKVDDDDNRYPDTPHPGGTKEGGTLDPDKYEEFGQWLAEGVQLYKDLGIDLYAFSPQNEPLFKQSYNSCFYRAGWYADMISNSIPVVKERFPSVRVFGAENMLAIEAGSDRQYFYHEEINQRPDARRQIDIFAVHGYTDGVVPTANTKMARLWRTFDEEYAAPTQSPIWMTETSGYVEQWDPSAEPGAFDLGLAIHSALTDGNASAWIWWQGSGREIDEYTLMAHEKPGMKYYVSKQFYRYIRPGARRVDVDVSEEGEGLFATAFEHTERDIFTVVLINSSDRAIEATLHGSGLPGSFSYFITNPSNRASEKDEVSERALVPSKSIVTLVSGDVYNR